MPIRPLDHRTGRWTPSMLALSVLVAISLVAGIATAAIRAGETPPGRAPVRASGPAPSSTRQPPGAPATTTPTAPAVPPGRPPNPTQDRLLTAIQGQVAQLRGLAWKSPLATTVVAKNELAARVRTLNARDEHPDRTAGDEATLKLLQLIPGGLDYVRFTDDLLAEQVEGFYDPKTKQLVVGDDTGGTISPVAKVALAHEMDHALTDQYFDFGTKTQALDDADRQEEAFAFTSLIEGDAVLLQTLWARKYLSPREMAAVAGPEAGGSAVFDRAPKFLKDSLSFPYTFGLDFVLSLYRNGGFAPVNAAYRRPPVSTTQILHPRTYETDRGWSPPPLPAIDRGTGCSPVRSGTLGEYEMAELLSDQIDPGDATDAAAGWSGDSFAVVRCSAALGLAEIWDSDTNAAAARLAAALLTWAQGWSGSAGPAGGAGTFSGPKGAGRVTHEGRQVVLVLGDNQVVASQIAAALGQRT